MKSLIRKVAAGVLAAATMLGIAGLGATTASAEDATGTLTVTSSDAAFNGKKVNAYQMFSASPDAAGQNATYTLASPWDNFFKTNADELGITGVTDANVSEKALPPLRWRCGKPMPLPLLFTKNMILYPWAAAKTTIPRPQKMLY